MGRRENFLEHFTRTADLNAEPMLRLPLVEIWGQQRVLVENHQGVNQYSCNKIGIKVCYGYLSICGTNLKLLQMTKERLVVTGCIESVQIMKRR